MRKDIVLLDFKSLLFRIKCSLKTWKIYFTSQPTEIFIYLFMGGHNVIVFIEISSSSTWPISTHTRTTLGRESWQYNICQRASLHDPLPSLPLLVLALFPRRRPLLSSHHLMTDPKYLVMIPALTDICAHPLTLLRFSN